MDGQLSERLKIICTNIKSILCSFTSGVPQGSALDHKSFIYINDINSKSKILDCILPVDDTTFYYTRDNIEHDRDGAD